MPAYLCDVLEDVQRAGLPIRDVLNMFTLFVSQETTVQWQQRSAEQNSRMQECYDAPLCDNSTHRYQPSAGCIGLSNGIPGMWISHLLCIASWDGDCSRVEASDSISMNAGATVCCAGPRRQDRRTAASAHHGIITTKVCPQKAVLIGSAIDEVLDKTHDRFMTSSVHKRAPSPAD